MTNSDYADNYDDGARRETHDIELYSVAQTQIQSQARSILGTDTGTGIGTGTDTGTGIIGIGTTEPADICAYKFSWSFSTRQH